MIRYLLDTNMVIYVIKKRPLEALQTFNMNSGRMAISSITLAELFLVQKKAPNLKNKKEALQTACLCTNSD